MNRKVTLILLLLVAYISSFTQSITKQFTVPQLLQDYRLFVQSLTEAHPGLYRYTTQQKWDSLFVATGKKLTHPMSEEPFYKLLMPLVADIKCGHTKWNPEGKPDDRYPYRQDNLFPLKLYFAGKKAYVLYSYDSAIGIPAESEVISINGKGINDIVNNLTKCMTFDGKVRSSLYEELNHSFNGYFATFMDTAAYYHITLKTKEGMHEVTLPATTLKVITAREEANQPAHQLPLRLTYPQPNTAVLTIENFYVHENEQKYYPFIDSAFADLKEKGIRNLILDLRNNEGGEEDWGGYLYSYLTDTPFQYYKKLTLTTVKPYSFRKYAALPSSLPYIYEHTKTLHGEIRFTEQKYLYMQPPQANRYTGKVYVLINGLSYSVTAEFASMLHNYNRATFVGEETGGAYYGNSSGVFAIVTLPNTKLSVSIPLIGFYSNVSGYPYKDRGILPDYEVKRTADDVLQRRDVVMKYALQLVQSKK